MSDPLWGHVYPFRLARARAKEVLVVSEDDYNRAARDAVIVPLYRERVEPSVVLVELEPGLLANCTRVQAVEQATLGSEGRPCPREALTRVRQGVRTYLDLDRLLEGAAPRPVERPRSLWWPRQGDVRYAHFPPAGGKKMFGIVSDDDWNSRSATTYSAAVRLTSKTRSSSHWRSRWEAPVTGGCVVAGHVYSILHEDLDRAPPRPPRPRSLTPDELTAIADRVEVLLRL